MKVAIAGPELSVISLSDRFKCSRPVQSSSVARSFEAPSSLIQLLDMFSRLMRIDEVVIRSFAIVSAPVK